MSEQKKKLTERILAAWRLRKKKLTAEEEKARSTRRLKISKKGGPWE